MDASQDYTSRIPGQKTLILPSFELESGAVLEQAPIAYKTWGILNERKDNVMVICHAFTGTADVEDCIVAYITPLISGFPILWQILPGVHLWTLTRPFRWGPLIGIGKAFDLSHYFIFCANVLGSPYGSASPVTINPATNQPYGPEFPATTNRDDVRAHKLVLDHLGVASVAVVVGGSMGGMATLEWPLCTPPGYVKHIIPLATSARHSAWCISWSEAQRQSIYADPLYLNGYYRPSAQPKNGLAAARMAAVLTYRSRDSFEGRFGRKPQLYAAPVTSQTSFILPLTPPRSPSSSSLTAFAAHNEGNRNSTSTPLNSPVVGTNGLTKVIKTQPRTTTVFSAQSYLRYQGDKFTSRFDANCYLHITRKLDTHDVARGRVSGTEDGAGSEEALAQVLGTIPRGALVIGIDSDGLFTPSEQHELAAHIPDAELVIIQSKNGHDGFLLEFEEINRHISGFLRKVLPELYQREEPAEAGQVDSSFEVTRTSTFGEVEVDVAMW